LSGKIEGVDARKGGSSILGGREEVSTIKFWPKRKATSTGQSLEETRIRVISWGRQRGNEKRNQNKRKGEREDLTLGQSMNRKMMTY